MENKFRNLSDREIDIEMTILGYGCQGWALNKYGTALELVNESGGIFVQRVVDYCNSWELMGPKLLDYNIVLIPCMGSNLGDVTAYFENKNPITVEFNNNSRVLRAAAELCLMVAHGE